ncbi:acetyl-CoA carboxylase [Aureococcus anophagefferens]|nr:acetyl-CoA carboxylase [Aureococcus anophagefferens]
MLKSSEADKDDASLIAQVEASLEQVQSQTVNRDLRIYIGDDRAAKVPKLAAQSVFVRRVSHSTDLADGGAALLDSAPTPTWSSSRSSASLAALRREPRRADEIEIKFASRESESKVVPRAASRRRPRPLAPAPHLHREDGPVTGVRHAYCDLDGSSCVVDPYPAADAVGKKRANARRVGTTYVYDFVGLLATAQLDAWKSRADDAKELTGADLEIPDISSITPEYPEGREVVIVANDVTYQSGSFGVSEDDFFYKVTRRSPLVGIKWVGDDPSKGLEYLYVSEADLVAARGSADAKPANAAGHCELEAIIGAGDQVPDGIGVENLAGSGLIAGVTSRAYEETFTPPRPAGHRYAAADGTPYDAREILDNAEGTGLFDGVLHGDPRGLGQDRRRGPREGGIPFGVISVETRTVEPPCPLTWRTGLARVKPQAGQVWYPDSAHKTATAIADFNRGERLPLLVLANWRAWRDAHMYDEVLKFAKIADELTKYDMPVFVYIPPKAELRGGASSSTPPSTATSWRCQVMHRTDPELIELDADPAGNADAIAAREAKLAPSTSRSPPSSRICTTALAA